MSFPRQRSFKWMSSIQTKQWFVWTQQRVGRTHWSPKSKNDDSKGKSSPWVLETRFLANIEGNLENTSFSIKNTTKSILLISSSLNWVAALSSKQSSFQFFKEVPAAIQTKRNSSISKEKLHLKLVKEEGDTRAEMKLFSAWLVFHPNGFYFHEKSVFELNQMKYFRNDQSRFSPSPWVFILEPGQSSQKSLRQSHEIHQPIYNFGTKTGWFFVLSLILNQRTAMRSSIQFPSHDKRKSTKLLLSEKVAKFLKNKWNQEKLREWMEAGKQESSG